MMEILLQHTPLLYLTQSLWRDEAFSILTAERPLLSVLGKLTFEPPVYYTLLHFWMKIFGNSEIATRSLSFVAFALATIIVVFWAEKLYGKHWLSWYTPIFFFLNPMLLYYAFEVRTYGLYILFATLAIYAYSQKHWRLYALGVILGFYTHTYLIIVPLVTTIHYVLYDVQKLIKQRRFKSITADSFLRVTLLIGLAIAPWLIRIIGVSSKLKQSWYFPVDTNLITSVLGNMFLGYEGTPWYLWQYTAYLSAILLLFFLYAIKKSPLRTFTAYMAMMITIPLAFVIGISFIKPLFVNRYLLCVTIAEVFLLTAAIQAIKKEFLKRLSAGALLAGIIVFNSWYPKEHRKVNLRETFRIVNALRKPSEPIYAASSLIYFESMYYTPDRQNVYLYNPDGSSFPWFVGDAIFDPSRNVADLPTYPKQAFIIHENGTFETAYRTETQATSIENPPAIQRRP